MPWYGNFKLPTSDLPDSQLWVCMSLPIILHSVWTLFETLDIPALGKGPLLQYDQY